MSTAKAKVAYNLLINSVRTVVLGTVNADNIPNVSYAPFVIDEAKNIYIFVSKLSTHTYNLRVNSRASIMLIEDETKSKQIFSRRRVRYSCNASKISKDSPEWECIANKFDEKFGNIVYIFRNFPDLDIIKFQPCEGIFVMGFGAAYKIYSNDLNNLVYITEEDYEKEIS